VVVDMSKKLAAPSTPGAVKAKVPVSVAKAGTKQGRKSKKKQITNKSTPVF